MGGQILKTKLIVFALGDFCKNPPPSVDGDERSAAPASYDDWGNGIRFGG